MRAMWLSRSDALQCFRAAVTTTGLPGLWPSSSTGPFALAYAVSANSRRLFDLDESNKVLGFGPPPPHPIDQHGAAACHSLCRQSSRQQEDRRQHGRRQPAGSATRDEEHNGP